ncbi:Btc22 family type III secretion system chaperone [Achromobacter denitrificans]
MSQNKTPEQIHAEAQRVVEEARRALEQADEFYRGQGLDPEKVRAVTAERLGPKERDEAEALFRQDLEAVENEVAQEQARQSFAAPAPSGGMKKMRPMV